MAQQNGRALAQYSAGVNAETIMREQAQARWLQRTARDAAEHVASEMVRRSAMDHPDVFGSRDIAPLVALITEWIISSGGE